VGTLGFAVSPSLYVALASRFGLQSSPFLAVPGLLLFPLLFAMLPRETSPRARAAEERPLLAAAWSFLAAYGPALLPLYVLVVVRSMVFTAFSQFVPTLMLRWGHSEELAGLASTVYSAGGAVGMLIVGTIASRFDRRWIQAASVLTGVPLAFVFLSSAEAPAAAALGLLGASGFCLNATNTMHILMGQEVAPRHASTISSLMMGFGWGLGAVSSVTVGWLAGPLGLPGAMAAVSSLPLLALPLVFCLRPRAAEAASSEDAGRGSTVFGGVGAEQVG
jgi:predicted MFS family arabinose efflux permease